MIDFCMSAVLCSIQVLIGRRSTRSGKVTHDAEREGKVLVMINAVRRGHPTGFLQHAKTLVN